MKPAAVVISKYDPSWKIGRYGPIWPKTPGCQRGTVANVKAGHSETIRSYGYKRVEELKRDPYLLAPLKLHYLRQVLFDNDTRFMQQGIFDTVFHKQTEDAISSVSINSTRESPGCFRDHIS